MQDNNHTYLAGMGTRIRLFRKMIRLKQTDMAELMGVSEGQYRRYETGKIAIPADKLIPLLLKYDLNQNWLLTGEGNMKATQMNTGELKYLREENQRLKETIKKMDDILEKSRDDSSRNRRDPLPGIEGA